MVLTKPINIYIHVKIVTKYYLNIDWDYYRLNRGCGGLNDMFKNSLKTRLNLDAQSFSFRKFSEEQHEFVMGWLKREFWNGKQQKALDYVLRVLQQEMFIRIFMDFYGFHGSNYSQAEVKMARWE